MAYISSGVFMVYVSSEVLGVSIVSGVLRAGGASGVPGIGVAFWRAVCFCQSCGMVIVRGEGLLLGNLGGL